MKTLNANWIPESAMGKQKLSKLRTSQLLEVVETVF